MIEDDEDEDPSFVQRHMGLIFLGIILLVAPGIVYAARKISSGGPTTARQSEIIVRLPAPPPPPPPRPQPTPEQTPPPEQQEQKMMEQPREDDAKKPEPPKEKAPAALGTGITGPGAGSDLGLSQGIGGEGNYGNGSNGSGRSKYGWYASQVQSRIADAIRSNPRTRRAAMNIVVRIWPDSTGRVVKAHIAGSTGDLALDKALQNDILTGLQLADPPPADMPLPIVMRLSAQRPH